MAKQKEILIGGSLLPLAFHLSRGDTRYAHLYILQINLQDHSFNLPDSER